MAGHSKWSNIRHRKAAQDAKRGKIFTKLIREITVAAREGGSEIADNPRLRAVVDKALSANMTRDTIERAIKRGAGEDDRSEEHTSELQSRGHLVCRLLLEKKKSKKNTFKLNRHKSYRFRSIDIHMY